MSGSAVQAGKRATYPAYKPSGVAWLGDVPEHWEVRRLKYSADLINQKVDGAEADLPYMGLEHIESWTGKRLGQNGDASSDGQANLFRRGDVLFGKLRPYLAKAYAADSEGICTGELLVLRPKAVEQKFLLDYVLNPDFVTIVDSSTYGAKMPRANWDFIGNLPTLIPPLDEQKAIAAFLDRETARIDALIEKKRRQIELLREKRSALISHAVTKGLNPNAPMKDSGIKWLGKVPKHWTVGNIRRFAKMRTGHTPSRTKPEYWENCTIPWFTLADVWQLRDGRRKYLEETKEKISELGLAHSAAELLPPGTVVFSRTASVGFSGIMPQPMATSQDFWNWVCLPSLLPEYLLCLFRAMRQEFAAITMGSTHKTIYQPIAAGIMICVPPREEQEAIAGHIDSETGRIDALSTKIAYSIDRLQDFRVALISAAVTGKIDVRGEVRR